MHKMTIPAYMPAMQAKKGVAKLRPRTVTTGEFGSQILTGAPKLSKYGAITTPGRERWPWDRYGTVADS